MRWFILVLGIVAAVIEASLRVRLPCAWVTRLTEHGATVRVVEEKPAGPNRLQALVEIDPGDADRRAIERTLRTDPYVEDLELIMPPKGTILGSLWIRECHACATLAESSCYLIDATATAEAGLLWRLYAPRRPAVESLVRALKARGLEVELSGIRAVDRLGALTERQQRVIETAFALGFFEFPRRINLTALAKRLNVAKSTLAEILHGGESKILHAYLRDRLRMATGRTGSGKRTTGAGD